MKIQTKSGVIKRLSSGGVLLLWDLGLFEGVEHD
jgi:hypothetical protein